MTDPAEYGSPTDDEIRDLTRGMPPALVKRFQVVATTMLMTKEHFNDRTPWRHLVDVFAKFPARWEKVDIIDSRGEHVTIEAYVNRGVGKHGFHSALVEPSLALADLLEEIEKERVRNKENGRAGGRPPTRQDELRQSLERAIEKHGIKKMMEQPMSWILDRVLTEWQSQHHPDAIPPADGTIRRVIALRLPDHPKLKKKICKKPGS